MARKYSSAASKKVEKAMDEQKRGTLKSGSTGKKVTSRKQAIAIGLTEARREGKKVPTKTSSKYPRRRQTAERDISILGSGIVHSHASFPAQIDSDHSILPMSVCGHEPSRPRPHVPERELKQDRR